MTGDGERECRRESEKISKIHTVQKTGMSVINQSAAKIQDVIRKIRRKRVMENEKET